MSSEIGMVISLVMEKLLPMSVFAFATSASPGPINIILAMSGARFGVIQSIPYVIGATFGFIGVLLAVGIGLGELIVKIPIVRVLLTLGGAIYMLNLAYRIARADMTDAFTETITKAPSVFSGVLAQVSNPKAWIVSIAAVSIYVNSSDYYNFTLILFCVVFFFACSLSLLGWSAIGATARKNFGNLRRFNVIMAILLTTSIALMLKDILSEFKHFFEYT